MKHLGKILLRDSTLRIVALTLLLSLGGCRGKDLIDDQTMEQMLYEMYIAQSMTEQIDSLRARMNDSALEVYAPIVARHGHTMDEFDSMLALYSVEPKRLDAILDHLVARMEEEKASLIAPDTMLSKRMQLEVE